MRGALEGLQVLGGDAEVLEPKRLERFEPEDVSDDRGAHVGDRPLLEQVELVGDVRDVLLGVCPGYRHDAEAFTLIVVVRRKAVGPNHRPRRRRGLAGYGRPRLLGVHFLLRRDAERRDDVGFLRLVVGPPVPHLLVGYHPRQPARPLSAAVRFLGHSKLPSINGSGSLLLEVAPLRRAGSARSVHRLTSHRRALSPGQRPLRCPPPAA